MRALLEGPGDPYLRGCRVVGPGDGRDLLVVGAVRRPLGAALAGDGEERDEGDALLAADPQHFVAAGVVEIEPEAVLHAHHRRDGAGLLEVARLHVGEAEVADQSLLAQFGERAEVLGDGVLAHPAQVHHVQVVAAELTQVLLDVAAQVVGARGGAPLPRAVPERPDLRDDDQIVRVRRQGAVDQFVGGAPGGEVERSRVDVVHAELDRPAQDGDRAVPVARGTEVKGGAARQPHRAEADAVDGQVAEFPGARGVRGDRFGGHRRSLAHPRVAIACAEQPNVTDMCGCSARSRRPRGRRGRSGPRPGSWASCVPRARRTAGRGRPVCRCRSVRWH